MPSKGSSIITMPSARCSRCIQFPSADKKHDPHRLLCY